MFPIESLTVALNTIPLSSASPFSVFPVSLLSLVTKVLRLIYLDPNLAGDSTLIRHYFLILE